VNIIRKGYKQRAAMCKDKMGNLNWKEEGITEMGRTFS
jgi:hypothetical protein